MIAILSDFQDSEYLGVMKGVIYSMAKNAKIADLYNYVNAQKMKEGAWILLNSCKYFPKKTVFLCVVDPGVGSKRQCIAIRTKNYFFVGPDNGLMFPAANEDEILEVIKIKQDKNISKTFHGRDVFARAAAKLENGIGINKLGVKAKIKNELNFYLKNRLGEVVRIDNFGNIITNLPSLNRNSYSIRCNNTKKTLKFYETYAKAPENSFFLIKGSSNTLEISIKNKNANKKLSFNIGDRIEIK